MKTLPPWTGPFWRAIVLLVVVSSFATSLTAQPSAGFRYLPEKCVPRPPGLCFPPSQATADSPAFCATNLQTCNTNPNCLKPTVQGPYLEVSFEPSGDRRARYDFDVIAPWNAYASVGSGQGCNPNGTHKVRWRTTPFPSNYCPSGETLLQPNQWDHYETWVNGSTLSCSVSSSVTDGPWYVIMGACQQPCCPGPCPPFCQSGACVCGFSTWEEKTVPAMQVTPRLLGCERPPARPCDRTAGACCLPGGAPSIGGIPGSQLTGGGRLGVAALPPAANGVFVIPEGGAPAAFRLAYFGGAAGRPGFPGASAWSSRLGQGWSHVFAQRIVADPDEQHVWLIDGDGGFTEFADLTGAAYATVLPADEKRTLEWLGAGLGWRLLGLDGSEIFFQTNGQWLQTTDRLGKLTTGSYSGGALTGVALPDQRSFEIGYHGSGKLESIEEIGVDGTTSRTWTYAWAGQQLARIKMPDGRAWVLAYSSALLPLLARQRLEPAGGGTARVERAWEYDAEGVLLRTWKGADSFAAAEAVEQYEFAHPTDGVTVITDPYGNDTTYTWDREPDSGTPRIRSMVGDCPSCGASPETTWAYTDAVNPLSPTVIQDALGHLTETDYDANGMVTNRREAVGTGDMRETFWDYGEPAFPAFPTTLTRPSVIAGCPAGRATGTVYDPANGRPTSTTVSGCEQPDDTTVNAYTTIYDYTGTSGAEPTTIDPPAHGTDDRTTLTYYDDRGDALVKTRTEPNPTTAHPSGTATTSYFYDPFNRLAEVVDPNGLHTYTCYDAMDRVTRSVRSTAAQADPCTATTGAGVLVTRYDFDPGFKDLLRVVLPRGNAIEYGYEADTGRLETITRKETDTGPGRQRERYATDDYGHRTLVERQELDGTWQTHSKTAYEYSTRCHLDRILHDPDGAPTVVTEYGYDCDGNLKKVWDAEHPNPAPPDPPVEPSQTYDYDPLHRLTTVTLPWGGSGGGTIATHYDYDVQDHLTQVIDAEGNTTDFIYNDRDLLVRETVDWLVDPLADCTTDPCAAGCGCTANSYDDHGELLTSTDPRGIETSRAVDAADRVTHIDFGTDDTLDVDLAYGETAAQFDVGRLTGIARHGVTAAYEYDSFGRMAGDGALGYGYDDNGNRTAVSYPGGVSAAYSYDYADREKSLAVDTGSGPLTIVSDAGYEPSGPLAALTFGSGLSETRAFDNRYFPEAITVPGDLLDWSYTTDAVGDVTRIEDLTTAPEPDRVYAYQPYQYFLNSAAGPWPGPLSWTYDGIGNRASEARGADTDTYDYTTNGTGNTPLLEQIILGAGGGTRDYTYGPAGHLESVTSGASVVDFVTDGEGRLAALERAGDSVPFLYDGRSFLSLGGEPPIFGDGFDQGDAGCWSSVVGSPAGGPCTTPPPLGDGLGPVYSSEGVLNALRRTAVNDYVFYLAGRPVALLRSDGVTDQWLYLTTDHLGTPVLATDGAGTETWSSGFEPFGIDWQAGTAQGASENGVWLRFPGQWTDSIWENVALGADVYQNVHRWYQPRIGRSNRPDPLGRRGDPHPYVFALSNPLVVIDPYGLYSIDGSCTCPAVDPPGGGFGLSPLGIEGLRVAVDTACLQLDRITDPKLRKCIQISCDRGTIRCDSACEEGVGGYNPRRGFVAFTFKNRIAVLCSNNLSRSSGSPFPSPSPTFLGEAVVHEWAHGCRWDHGDGKGVPRDPGPDNEGID